MCSLLAKECKKCGRDLSFSYYANKNRIMKQAYDDAGLNKGCWQTMAWPIKVTLILFLLMFLLAMIKVSFFK